MEQSDSSQRTDRKRPWYKIRKVQIIMVVMVAIIIIGSLTFVLNPVPKKSIIIKSNDVLLYSVTTNTLNETIVTDGHVNIGYATDSGFGYSAGHYPSSLWDSDMEFELVPMMWEEGELGHFVMNQKIETEFGWKGVRTYIQPEYEFMIITDVGLDSHIIYKRTWTSFNCTVQYELTGTGNKDIWVADGSYWDEEPSPWTSIKDDPMTIMDPPGTRMYQFGSIGIEDGQHIRYNMTGDAIYGIVFDLDDIRDIDRTMWISFNEELSLTSGNGGAIDVDPEGSSYYYLFTVTGGTMESRIVSYL